MVSRECLYYINLRHAYLLSPFYANRLSSRTVLYMNVPRSYLDEDRLRWILGKSVKRVWIPQSTRELENLVEEREQTAMRLEKAEFTLIRLANAARAKALKDKKSKEKVDLPQSLPELELDEDEIEEDSVSTANDRKTSSDLKAVEVSEKLQSPTTVLSENGMILPDVNGSVASQWLSHSSRPHHRPIANYGRRVDTIKWTRNRIKKLNVRIAKARRQQLFKPESMMPSVFVEFETHTDAQNAYQTLTHHRPLHMSQRYLGVKPFEIVWSTLSKPWWEMIARRFLVKALIAAMIIFWSIPSALVGTISNIEYLSQKVPFLHWVGSLPSSVKGILSGVIPALALSLLMSIVPLILRRKSKPSFKPSSLLSWLFLITLCRLRQTGWGSDS